MIVLAQVHKQHFLVVVIELLLHIIFQRLKMVVVHFINTEMYFLFIMKRVLELLSLVLRVNLHLIAIIGFMRVIVYQDHIPFTLLVNYVLMLHVSPEVLILLLLIHHFPLLFLLEQHYLRVLIPIRQQQLILPLPLRQRHHQVHVVIQMML